MALYDQRHGKMRFLTLSKIFIFIVKKVSFLSRTLLYRIFSLILSENKKMKKLPFYDQKHGLTPLKKYDFWDNQKFLFSLSKKSFFSI